MNYKFSISNHIYKRLALFLISLAVAGVGINYFAYLKLKPKDYETFSLFISSSSVDTSFKKHLQNLFGEDILQINIYKQSPDGAVFSSAYSAQGYNSDVLILREDTIIQNDAISFAKLPISYQNASIYSENAYAIKEGISSKYSNFINYDTDSNYYLFVNPNSQHLNGIADGSKTNKVVLLLEDLNNVQN